MTVAEVGWMLEEAARVAHQAHRGQTRIGGEPYIRHPERVAAAVAAAGFGAEYVMAAWLHDVVEDSPISLHNLTVLGFPQLVVDAVDAVTRRPGETYAELIGRAAAHPVGRIVKWFDNLDNSSEESLAQVPEGDRAWRVKRYARARAVLAVDEVAR